LLSCSVFINLVSGFSLTGNSVDGKLVKAEPTNITAPTNLWAVAHNQTTENCWPWKISENPRLVVVVRWYIEQELSPLLVTLNSAASLVNETIVVKIVDTNPIPSKTNERGELSFTELMRQISACSALVPWLRIQGLMAPVLSPGLENLYGYGQSDWVLEQLQDVEYWDHIMFTNGDNTYSRYLLEQTLDARRFGYALIAFDYVLHHKRDGIPNKVMTNTLKYKHNDLGSMILHRGVVDLKGEGCSCGCTFSAGSMLRGWYAADSGLMELTQQCSRNSQIIISQVLLHHQ